MKDEFDLIWNGWLNWDYPPAFCRPFYYYSRDWWFDSSWGRI